MEKTIAPLALTVLITILVVLSSVANAATINAYSCSQAHIKAAIDSASDGDTVVIPGGNCSFTSAVEVDLATGSKALTIFGSGIGETIISDHGFKVTGANGKRWRLAEMTLVGGAGVTVYGQSKEWRVDHIYFDHPTGETQGRVVWIQATGSAIAYTTGVIDNCTFDNPGVISIHVRGNNILLGNETWARSLGLGGSDAIYIENCTFEMDDTRNRWVVDCEGANYVFRYNTVKNLGLGMHDAIIGGIRGCRKWEIYENDFTIVNKWDQWVTTYLRGGTGVVFNNRWNGPSTGGPLAVATYRYYQTGGDPWDELCDGNAGKATLGLTDNPGDCESGDDCVNIDGIGGWPCRDQLGTDGGKEQSNVPALFWNNKYSTYDPRGYNPDEVTNISLEKGASAPTMVEGRDYCMANDTIPASCNDVATTYVPYAYPHPVRSPEAPKELKTLN